MDDREKVCPLADAKLDRTAIVLKGWTMTHPTHPPSPDEAKTTDCGNGGALATGGARVGGEAVVVGDAMKNGDDDGDG